MGEKKKKIRKKSLMLKKDYAGLLIRFTLSPVVIGMYPL